MTRQERVAAGLAAMKQAAPTGYAIALHIRYTTPSFLFQTYPKAWIDHYSGQGLVMRDPTVRWGIENSGTIRWSALAGDDPHSVLADAARHGLDHGFTVALEEEGSRSLASFTRGDREFTDEEMHQIEEQLRQLHDLTAEIDTLAPETRERLRRLSITFTHP